jgi:pimeloyl-ACP methyl ester carboxylesterase
MSHLSPEELEARAQAIVATFGTRLEGRRLRLAREVTGVEQHMIAAPSGPIAAWRVGEGPAVLLVHGFADSHALWSPLMAGLIARGRAFVALDLPGHGRSGDGWGAADDGVDAMFAVAAALGPIDAVVAHSMSGSTATCALAEGLPAKRAVMVAIATNYRREFVVLETRAPPDAPPEVLERARQILISTTPESPRFDIAAAAGKLSIPGLLIHSRDDERWSPAATDYLARHWSGAETFYVVGLDHRGVARDPAVVDRILDFLT